MVMAITIDERTRDDIVVDIIGKLRARNIGLTNFSTGSVVRAIVDLVADEVEDLNGYVVDLYNGLDLNNRTGADLDIIGEAIGVSRRNAKKGMGIVTFYTGDNPASADILIPSGYVIETYISSDEEEQVAFETVSDATIHAGESSVSVPVISVEAGALSIPLGNLNVMTEDIQGINSVMNQAPIISGSGVQSDEDYRILIANGNKNYGTADAIREEVLKVDGVKNCWIEDSDDNLFKIMIAFDTDDTSTNRNIVAPNVLEAVYKVKPVGVIPYIDTVSYQTINLTISATGTTFTTEQQNQIRAILEKYINELKPYEDFLNASAEMNINSYVTREISSSVCATVKYGGVRADITPDSGKMFQLGTLTF